MLSRPERYLLHSGSAEDREGEDDSLENDLSSLMEDDSDRQLVQTGAPTVFGPPVSGQPQPHLHLQQSAAVDSRSVNIYQMGMSEEAAKSIVDAKACMIAAEAQALVANTTAAAERQVSLARAEAANMVVNYQKAASSAEADKAAVVAKAGAALAAAHSEVASTAARAEQHVAQAQ